MSRMKPLSRVPTGNIDSNSPLLQIDYVEMAIKIEDDLNEDRKKGNRKNELNITYRLIHSSDQEERRLITHIFEDYGIYVIT